MKRTADQPTMSISSKSAAPSAIIPSLSTTEQGSLAENKAAGAGIELAAVAVLPVVSHEEANDGNAKQEAEGDKEEGANDVAEKKDPIIASTKKAAHLRTATKNLKRRRSSRNIHVCINRMTLKSSRALSLT